MKRLPVLSKGGFFCLVNPQAIITLGCEFTISSDINACG
jgi:hypothetical protein